MNLILQTILSILAAILISAITSWITVRLSLKQFYSQKWWERKADAYSTIIEALYHVKNNTERFIDIEMGRLILTEKEKQTLIETSRKGYEEIYKAESIGAFVVSEEVIQSLTKLRKKIEGIEVRGISIIDDLSDTLSAVNDCLKEIRICAKQELNFS